MSLMPMDPNNPLYRLLNPGMPQQGGMGGIGGLFNRGTSWMPSNAGFGNPGVAQQGGGSPPAGIRGLLANPDFALALLANSGGQQKKSFGEVLGQAGLQTQQMGQQREDAEFQRQYRQAQMDALRNPVRKPIAVMGPDGKPVYVDEQDAIGKSPLASGSNGIGAFQPGDYTPESFAKYLKDGDVSKLVRYVPPRQETSKPFQNITRTYPDGSTQQGNFDTRTGDFTPTGPLLPPGIKPEADAAGTARGKISGDLEGKGPRAYEQFKIGMAGLESAMENTVTGPLVGRMPALTSAQQTAEGSEAIMAPVLKQLFREAGEGTFTEGDQELLLRMVPNRKDHAEARKAKMEMIDGIVRAKLGMAGADSAPTSTPSAKTPGVKPQARKRYNPATGKIE